MTVYYVISCNVTKYGEQHRISVAVRMRIQWQCARWENWLDEGNDERGRGEGEEGGRGRCIESHSRDNTTSESHRLQLAKKCADQRQRQRQQQWQWQWRTNDILTATNIPRKIQFKINIEHRISLRISHVLNYIKRISDDACV